MPFSSFGLMTTPSCASTASLLTWLCMHGPSRPSRRRRLPGPPTPPGASVTRLRPGSSRCPRHRRRRTIRGSSRRRSPRRRNRSRRRSGRRNSSRSPERDDRDHGGGPGPVQSPFPIARFSAAYFGRRCANLSTRSRARYRPMTNARAARTVAAGQTTAMPPASPNRYPAPSVRIDPGTKSSKPRRRRRRRRSHRGRPCRRSAPRGPSTSP